MPCKIVADDFGMSEEINRAISELARRNMVSKVSVMANEPLEYSPEGVGAGRETGLHINLLTYAKGRGIDRKSRIKPAKLFYLVFTRQLDVMESIDNQFKMLESRGFRISYLDTHQHVHIIPVVLRSLVKYAKTGGINSIRCITMEKKHLFFYFCSLARSGFIPQIPKMMFLYSMGMLMRIMLDKHKIKYCGNLVLMPLAVSGDYRGLLEKFIKRFRETDAELVVHPALEAHTVVPDDYSSGRYVEYRALLEQAQP